MQRTSIEPALQGTQMPAFVTLLDGLSFADCPRWHDGRLYFSDRYTHRVLAASINGAVESYARISGRPAGIGFLPDGRLLIASMRDRKLLRREHDGSIVQHADLSALARGDLNDLLVDSEGRAWVGNFGFDLFAGAPASSTVLISVDTDGTAAIAAHDLAFPNGAAIAPDGRTLIIAETMAKTG
jgi:sugar lactone lactonase YvrE